MKSESVGPLSEPYVSGRSQDVALVETDAQRRRVGIFESKAGDLLIVLNGDECRRRFTIPVRAGRARDLLAGTEAAVEGGKVALEIETFGVRLLVIEK